MEDGVSESKVTKDESQVSRDLKPNIEIDYEDNSEKIQIILNSYIQTTATTTTNNKITTNTMSEQKCTPKKIIKMLIIILGIVVVLVIPFYISLKMLTKKSSVDIPEASPESPIDDNPINQIFGFSFFNFKYDSNKTNTIIFSDNFVKYFNIESSINYSQNSKCDFDILNYIFEDINYGYAYIKNAILNYEFENNIQESFNIDSDYDIIPIVHFINDSNGNIQILSYNKNMRIEYLSIINNFISNISNSDDKTIDDGSELNHPIKSNEFESDNYVREGIIKDYQINYNLNIDTNLSHLEEDEIKKIYEKIQLISFINLTSNSNLNLEMKENHKNLSLNDEQLRKLEINLDNSIFFNYSIFEINLNSIFKISLKAYLGLNFSNPNDEHVIIKLFMNVNDKEKSIINIPYNIAQFYNISSRINNVFHSVAGEIVKSLYYIENNLTNFKNDIYSNISFISDFIYTFTEFQNTLSFQNLSSNINNSFITGFNNSKIYATELYENFSDLNFFFQSIYDNISLINTNSIKLINDSIFQLGINLFFIFNQINDFYNKVNNIYSNSELDYENLKLYISLLENIKNNYLNYRNFVNNIYNIKQNLRELIQLNEYNTTNQINNSLYELINDIKTNQIIFDSFNFTKRNGYIYILEFFPLLSNSLYSILLHIIDDVFIFNESQINSLMAIYRGYETNITSSFSLIDNIIENLEEMGKLNMTNFTTYIEDLNIINVIHNRTHLAQVNSFKTSYISNFKFNKNKLIYSIDIETNILTSEQVNFDFLNEIFNETIKNLTKNITDNIDLNTNFQEYLKYNTTGNLFHVLNLFENRKKRYSSLPNELKKRMEYIDYLSQKEISFFLYKIKTAYINYINCTFSKLYCLVAEEIRKKYHNFITQDVDSQFIKMIKNNYNYNSYLNNIIKEANEQIQLFELELYKLITPDFYIETTDEIEVINGGITLDGIKFFNYHIGIIIEYINYFQNFAFDIENLINDNIIDKLDLNSYLNEFFELNTFDIISETIISQFNEFNNNSKEILSNEFNATINLTNIIYNYEVLNNDSFTFPFNLLLEIDNLLSASMTQIKKLFGNQISDYLNINKNISKEFNQTNFKSLFDGFKSTINNSYITYEKNYQSYSFLILDNLTNYQQKLVLEKSDLLINNINTTCSIISSNFCEPSILFIKNLSDYVNERIRINFTSISNNHFNSLIQDILYKLNESNEILLNTIDNEINNFISIINSNGNKDYNISNYDDIHKIFINFYTNFSNIFSNSFINQYLEKNIKNSLKNYTILHNSSEDFYKSFVENVFDLKKKDGYHIIEYYFNQSIDTFNQYIGYFVFDEFLTEVLINNVSSGIYYIHNIIKENFINEIITNMIYNEDYRITENLNNTLYNFYPNIKSLIKNNIESKIDKVIIHKLKEKINEISELIINQFADSIIQTWESEDFKSNFTEEIYNSISLNPKYLINRLNQSYLELMDNTIVNNIRAKINNLIMTNLTDLYKTLDDIHDALIEKLELLTLYNVEEETQNILNNLDDFYNIIHENDNNISSIIQDNLNFIHETYYKILTENISKINEIYQIEKNKSNFYLIKEFENFSSIDIPLMIESINNAYFNIKNILENNITKNAYDSLSNLDEIDSDIINSRLRRTNEYNIKKIDNEFNNYASKYENFGFDILNNTISFSTLYSNFSNTMINIINEYSELLKQIYQFEGYKDLVQIKDLYHLFGNETVLFKNTIEDIKNEINNISKNVENILKEKLDKSFEIIPNILDFIFQVNKTKNYQTIENFMNYTDNDVINNMITKLNIKNITYKNGYLFNYDKINHYLYFNLEVDANTIIDANNTIDFLTERINGELGNAIIGLNVFYSIYNDSTTIEAYFNQKQSNYSSSIIIDQKYEKYFNLTNNYQLLYYTPAIDNKIKRTINYNLS